MHFLAIALIPALALVICLAVPTLMTNLGDLASAVRHGNWRERTGELLFSGFLLLMCALPVLYWLLLRRKWYRSWRKYVLVIGGSIPVGVAAFVVVGILWLVAACLLQIYCM
jgi:hypothetical protein